MTTKLLSLHCKTWGMLCLAGGALTMASCAQDGFDDETFDSGVRNTQLEAPSVDDIKITPSTDGSMQTISWPVVYGAGGYHAILTNVDNNEVVKDTLIDNITFATKREEDVNYKISLAVLDNKEKNNKGTEAVEKTFNTFTPSFATIPNGTDLAVYFKEYPLPDQGDDAIVYDLQANGQYTMSEKIDFGSKNIAIRTAGNNATLTLSDGACFIFGNGFKLQNLNIDNTDNTANGLLTMSSTPDENLSISALGYKDLGADQNGYIMTNPVTLKNVNVKGLKKSLIYGNKTDWSLVSLSITGCIVQLDNETSSSVINLYGAKNGLIKSMTVKDNTFYNLKKNESAYFLRYSNSSNAQPKKIFGSAATAELTISENTFANVFTGKDFANNLANTNMVTTTLTSNIFYDVFKVYQFIQANTIRRTTNNFIWWVNTERQANDISRTDSDGNPICTEADPGFPAIEALTTLDFSVKNCGVNFTPSGIPADNKAGDPRWLPSAE